MFVSNFLKLFQAACANPAAACAAFHAAADRIQYYVILGALKETLMLGFIAKARFWQPQIGLLSAEPLAGLCC